MALPNVACPGLPGKLLDASIGQLLAPYHPSRCQGNSKQNNNKIIDQLCWNGCSGVPGTIPHALPNGGGPGLW